PRFRTAWRAASRRSRWRAYPRRAIHRARRAWAQRKRRRAARDSRRLRAEARSSRRFQSRWDARDRAEDSQYSEVAGPAREPEQIRRRQRRADECVAISERASVAGSDFGYSLTARCHACCARGTSFRRRWARPIFTSRSGRFGLTVLEHLLELDQRLPIVALGPVRLADPVLGVAGQRMLRVLRDEVLEVDHGLSVLSRAIRRERSRVLLLGVLGSRPRRRD